MRVLVTAGPTREHLDDVRFLSNPSSGRMGFACAAAAAASGHRVTLVTGPVPIPDPPRVKVIRVVSAAEMRSAAMKAFARAEAVIASAAVSDYRPARRAAGKLKKDAARMTLALVRTPDILAEMGARKGRRVLIGFALETRDGMAQARGKLARKNLDAVVLNGPASFGSPRIAATILTEHGVLYHGTLSKADLARRLVRLAEARGAGGGRRVNR